jgi:hypothetical protein
MFGRKSKPSNTYHDPGRALLNPPKAGFSPPAGGSATALGGPNWKHKTPDSARSQGFVKPSAKTFLT